jgi:hypothetical protein
VRKSQEDYVVVAKQSRFGFDKNAVSEFGNGWMNGRNFLANHAACGNSAKFEIWVFGN